MGNIRRVVLFIAVAMLPVIASSAAITDLSWLAGCWAFKNQEAGSGETWMPPAGGSMLGMNRTVRQSKTVAFEFMQIVDQGNGVLVFIASPSGQDTARFEMLSIAGNEVVFENPEHDFPQRVIYRLESDVDLLGRIEGLIDGTEKAVDFPMRKTACGYSQHDGI